jgi:hypothetical protein
MADAASGSGVLVDLEFQVTGIQQYNVDGKPKQRFKIRVRDYSTSQEWYICKRWDATWHAFLGCPADT